MPPASTSSASALQQENDALREELRLLRAAQCLPAAPQPQQQRTPSQARFRTVFYNSPLGQKIITSDLIIRQVNQAVVAMLGYTRPEELIGRKILEFTHPDYRADWQELQEHLWAHRLPYFTLETCLARADGTFFWCQITSVLFHDEGAELGYTILEDISVRKKLETKLRRLYDAQETILQLATHDLKGPIAHIELLVDLLQREVASHSGTGPPAPEMVQYLALIQSACVQAHALLADVLYVGDLDAEALQRQPTELNTYAAAQLEVHRLAAQAAGITLALDLPTEPVHSRIHRDKFSRVLDNLLGNALKFTPAGGTVTLRLAQHAGKARFIVQDTGIGIPSKLHANLFNKFNPTRRAGLQGEKTTGLGLFIAKQLVELHGGHIWLESREQHGTSFFIELAS